jgi:hypothetical protein
LSDFNPLGRVPNSMIVQPETPLAAGLAARWLHATVQRLALQPRL